MAVSTSYSPISFNGNGATTSFSVGWQFFTGTLAVTLISALGVETVKSITTHYTVSGGTDANGLPAVGTVTMLAAPASGERLRIERVTPKTQSTTWNESDGFPQNVVEAGFDRLTLISQEGGNAGTVNDGINGDVMELVTTGETDYWDAEDHIISNVADAVGYGDAVNLGQVAQLQLDGGSMWVLGDQTAVAGSAMGIQWKAENNGIHTARQEGGIWTGRAFSYAAISSAFDASTPNDANGPVASLFTLAVNNGAAGDVCAFLASAIAWVSNSSVFGANIIARSNSGVSNVKLVGLEIDVEPSIGVTIDPASGGLYINMFSTAAGPAIQTGGVGGGTWDLGLVLYGMAAHGVGVAAGDGQTLGALINTTSTAVYNDDAIIVCNQHRIRFAGPSSTHSAIVNDSSGNLRIVNGAGAIVFRNNADTASILAIDNAGNVDLQSAGTLKMRGTSSGVITFQGQAAAGTYNFNWPTSAGSSGQVLTSGGGSAAAMTWTTLGSLAALNTINNGNWSGTALAAANGGTGLTSYTVGDLLYASGSTALASLAAVASGQVLVSAGTGTAPAWSTTASVSRGLFSGGSADTTTVRVRQTSASTPASDVFSVQNNGGTTSYFAVNNNGASLFRSQASSDLTVVYDTTSAGQYANMLFRNGGTDRFYLRLRNDNDFDFIDSTAAIIWHGKAGGAMGIGTAAVATAFLKMAAGTTAKAQFNIPDSSAPSSPNNDDEWTIGFVKYRRSGGVTKSITYT